MKHILQSPRLFLMVAFFTIAFTSCSTWHYNHPRIQVDQQKNDEPQIEQSQLLQDGNAITTAEIINNEQSSPK